MKAVKIWPANTTCPLPGADEFIDALNTASYHNAAPGSGEMQNASDALKKAAEVAIEQEWPYWVMERIFKETRPLVAWDQFMQYYINILFEKVKVSG